MEKEDARYQTLERLHERRKQVVRLHKYGIKIMQIVTLTGLSYPTVKRSIELYERGSWEALRPADRGRSKGQGGGCSAWNRKMRSGAASSTSAPSS